MIEKKDIDIYMVHTELSTLFGQMKERVFELRKLGFDTTKLLIILGLFAEQLVLMAKSESERHERKTAVEELLAELKRGKNDERPQS